MAVALRVEKGRARAQDHHVWVQANVDLRRAPEGELDEDALLGVLGPVLAVLEVARAGVDDPRAMVAWPQVHGALDVQAAGEGLGSACRVHPADRSLLLG